MMLQPKKLVLKLINQEIRSIKTSSKNLGSTGFKRSFLLGKSSLNNILGEKRKPLPALDLNGNVIDENFIKSRRSSKASTSTLKPKKSIKLESIILESETLVDENSEDVEDSPSTSPSSFTMPMLESGIRRNLARYPGAILLTQVGSFFESYFDQAPIVSRDLHIKLTSKSFGKGDAKTRQPFCGFPLAQLSKHVSTLVEKGHKVVIVEEFRERGDVDGTLGDIGRGITRIVTAGTGVDEGFVRKEESNYVLALGILDDRNSIGVQDEIGLAYRDISTGASFTKSSSLIRLRDDIALVEPKEVVLDRNLQDSIFGNKIREIINGEEGREAWIVSIASEYNPVTSKSRSSPKSVAESILQSYLAETLVATPPPNLEATVVDPSRVMQLDSTTLKSLEIRTSLRGGLQGSLLSTVKRTVTPGGTRLLSERLCAPSVELKEINRRLSIVSSLNIHSGTRQYLRALLKSFEDTPRILQRLYMRRGTAFDLLGLKKTLFGVELIRKTLEDGILDEIFDQEDSHAILALVENLVDHSALAQLIDLAIDEEALMQRTVAEERRADMEDNLGASAAEKMEEEEEEKSEISKGLWGKNEKWVIRPEFSPLLIDLHAQLHTLRSKADALESSMRSDYNLPSLILKSIHKRGAVVYVKTSKANALDATKNVAFVGGSGSTRHYILASWSKLHAEIESTNTKLRELEGKMAQNLVAKVLDQFLTLQQTADTISELDVCLGFAELARDMDLVRPVVNNSTALSIEDGRHPTVEHALKLQGRPFIANSLEMSHPSSFVHCLTGPNMAGKSTYLRSMAIIAILAQSGSFVPATSVEIGVIDRIFSRVGARDELDRDRSTFMVEMDECTSILLNATDRSLVLLDELGRGTSPLACDSVLTSPQNGLSIAYAALEHLVQVNRSKTLFATHYHLLGEAIGCDNEHTSGTGVWEGLEFWCTEMEEKDDSVMYLHTVKRGLNSDSAGIVVARLAGFPDRAIEIALKVREKFKSVVG